MDLLFLYLLALLNLGIASTSAGDQNQVSEELHVYRRQVEPSLRICTAYQINVDMKVFTDAKDACETDSQTGTLAKIPTHAVNEALYVMFQNLNFADSYFGAQYVAEKDEFLYIDGSPICFTNWLNGRPFNDVLLACATFTLDGPGHWLDDTCHAMRPYICQHNEYDDCTPNPCQNGGSCHDTIMSYYCECTPDFTGTNCDMPPDCHTIGCQNGGVCLDGNGGNCDCGVSGNFEGQFCETCIPHDVETSGSFAEVSLSAPDLVMDSNSGVTSYQYGGNTYLITYTTQGTGDGFRVFQIQYPFTLSLIQHEAFVTNVKHIEPFEFNGDQYIAITVHDTTLVSLHSFIYKWNVGSNVFESFQTIVSNDVHEVHFHFFTSPTGEGFLVQTSLTVSGGDGGATLHQWSTIDNQFTEIQTITSDDCNQAITFIDGSTVYLILSSATNNDKVYIQDPNDFTFSSIAATGIEGLATPEITNFLFQCEHYIMVGTGPPSQAIYKWDAASLTFVSVTLNIDVNILFGDGIQSVEISGYPFIVFLGADIGNPPAVFNLYTVKPDLTGVFNVDQSILLGGVGKSLHLFQAYNDVNELETYAILVEGLNSPGTIKLYKWN